MNYIKIFQNAKSLEISEGISYTEYQLMHNFLEKYIRVESTLLI